MNRKIKDYEDAQKVLRDYQIDKVQEKEIKIEREKRFEMNTREKDEFKDNLDKRLNNYKEALREKAESEKQVIFISTFSLLA